MRINILGSSSKGNGYVLQNETEALLIECGVNVNAMLKAVDWRLDKVAGAVVSHEHNDHAGFIQNYLNAGVTTLALPEVFDSHGLSGNIFSREIEVGKKYRIGNFLVQPFSLEHDVPCVGYVVTHPEMGKLLFATDTYFIPYKVAGLNHIMIEANYADDILERRVLSGEVNEAMRKRLLRSHMELQTTKDFLRKQNLEQTDNIILIHLSDGSSDEARFKTEVAELTGKRVVCADAGEVIHLNY